MDVTFGRLNSQRGQTVVEYILLLSVAVSLVLTFYRSTAFQKLFGENGELGKIMKTQTEFSYRHGYMRNRPPGGDISRTNRDISIHPSYSNLQGETRFFGPLSKYGE